LSLVAFDRPFLLPNSRVFSLIGMNILRGQAFANRRGLILDIIQFQRPDANLQVKQSEVENFRETLQKVLAGVDLTELLRRRESSILFHRKSEGSISTYVSFDDQSSEV
jgi:hypothetical protein